MKKIFHKVLIGLLFATLFIFFGTGCDEKTSVRTIKNETSKVSKTTKVKTEKKDNNVQVRKNKIPKVDISDIFEDNAKITSKNRYMIIIFETDECPYCAKMNLDIKNNKKLHDELKKDFTVYKLDAMKNRLHKLQHEGKMIDVDTKTLIDIYGVNSTPTLIFTDKKGKSIFIVPGYMPQKQFLVTLDFVKSGVWLGKNRKNGEVYKALKQFYEKNGIMVSKRKNNNKT